MSRLDELINELCSNGVEYKKLGEVSEMQRGTSITKQDTAEGDIPVIAGGQKPAYFCDKSNRDGETITIAGSGAYAGYVAYWNTPIFVSDAFSIKGTIECTTKYLYYFLKNIQQKIYSTKKGAGVPHVHINNIDKFLIPVPPLPVQVEIVRILDKFTALEAELEKKLEAELEARNRQYEYYRDKFFSFTSSVATDKNRVEFKTMGEIGTFIRGKRFVRTDIVEKGVPCIHYGDMYMYYGHKASKTITYLNEEKASKMRFAKKNDVVIVGAGENKMDIGVGLAWLGEDQVAVHDACYIYRSDLEPRYVSHFLRTTDYHKNLLRWVSEGKICSVSAQSLSKTIIPVPPMEKQKQIADILDRFDALTTDLTQGLPAEIEARRQQYEYYRDKLLTFKRKTA